MKTLGEIISLRQNKYNEDRKNPSYTEFFQGRFDGWYSAYRDLKEILEQNGFNLDVPVIDVGKTNADHIRSMTDAEFAMHIVNTTRVCGQCPAFKSCEIKYPNFSVCMNEVVGWLKQPYEKNT